MAKKVFSLALVVLFILAAGNIAYAKAQTEPDALSTIPAKDITEKNVSGDIVKEYVEKDPQKLRQIIKQDKLSIPKGYHLESVKTTIMNDPAELNGSNQPSAVLPAATSYYTVENVVNRGDGWYYDDDYDSDWFFGPCSVSETYTETRSAGWNCTVGLSSSIVSAEVGFTIGSSYTKSKTFSTTVAAGKKLNVKIYVNYQKKTYDVYHVIGGLKYDKGNWAAWKPVGLIFKQYTYAA